MFESESGEGDVVNASRPAIMRWLVNAPVSAWLVTGHDGSSCGIG